VKERVISVTTAARTFADCVNRVRYQGVSFLLQKNGISVARIVPVDPVSGLSLDDVVAPPAEAQPGALVGAKEPSLQPKELSAEASAPESPNPPPRPILNW
jgi:antitoxin (DNA-binding transcriptional repressor) of toxin-antitoxin stability system